MRSMRGIAGALGALLLLSLPLPAAGDTSAIEVGLTGEHHLIDTAETPGAWCGYVWDDEYPLLFLIRVEPPVVFARDTTPARDHQRISWKVRLQANDGGEVWVYAESGYRRARAWDDTPADLDRIIVRLPSPVFEQSPGIRAIVEMRWHEPGNPGVIEGWSRHRVDFQLATAFGDPYTVKRCPTWGQPWEEGTT